jgi:hypothetical protein
MGQWEMENNDREFEEYLREFQPRKSRALPEQVIPETIWTRRLAAAAAVMMALGASLWSVRQKPAGQRAGIMTSDRLIAAVKQSPRSTPSLLVLTRLAVENPAGLDAALKATQENRLPRFDRKDSALRILAQE